MLSTLRTRRAAFWYLAPDRIVAAVVSRTRREPVLEACAASYSAPVAGSSFAPGVIEVAWVLGCERMVHIAALAAPFCRVDAVEAEQSRRSRWRSQVPEPLLSSRADPTASVGCSLAVDRDAVAGSSLVLVADSPGAAAANQRRGVIVGADGFGVWADEDAVKEAASLFRRARLHLLALDCEACALASLADALGTGDTDDARRQHLSAVAIVPESESAAEALGDDLAVPVGLAVAWFGAGRAV